MKAARRTLFVGIPVALAVIARAAFPVDGLNAYARAEIPARLVPVYKAAAKRCLGLPWQVLAAIGWVESRNGGGAVDSGTGDVVTPIIGPALDGAGRQARVPDTTQPDGWAHALGPMGLLSSAWARYATLAPGRPPGATPSVQNAWDAIHTTAAELCGQLPVMVDLNRAIRGHTPEPPHVMAVLLKAARYGSGDVPDVDTLVAAATAAGTGPGAGSVGAAAVSAAAQALGVPYVWGAESPAEGFDCSGLVWWAYRQAGITVPRTTDALIAAGTPVTDGRLQVGDLLFSRGGQVVHDLGHVSIYAGGGMEIVAPRSGRSVTVQKVDGDRVQAVRRIVSV